MIRNTKSLPEDLVPVGYSLGETSMDISEKLRESALAPGDGVSRTDQIVPRFDRLGR
jgi:hypothetical protein